MDEFFFRNASINDVPFLVDTIIEAEKSGTDTLTYNTIFGLTEEETKKYISEMLLEEVDGCELSISSFLVAEKNGQIVASVGAWIEGFEGVSSTVLKGNLLSFILPKRCIERAVALYDIVHELHIEYIPYSIQIGLVYVRPDFRGMNLAGSLIDKQIARLSQNREVISGAFVQVFGNNLAAIRAYEKASFKVQSIKESSMEKLSNYMPSNKKVLMKRELTTN